MSLPQISRTVSPLIFLNSRARISTLREESRSLPLCRCSLMNIMINQSLLALINNKPRIVAAKSQGWSLFPKPLFSFPQNTHTFFYSYAHQPLPDDTLNSLHTKKQNTTHDYHRQLAVRRLGCNLGDSEMHQMSCRSRTISQWNNHLLLKKAARASIIAVVAILYSKMWLNYNILTQFDLLTRWV